MPNFLFTWVDTFDYDPMRLLGRPVQEFFFFFFTQRELIWQ